MFFNVHLCLPSSISPSSSNHCWWSSKEKQKMLTPLLWYFIFKQVNTAWFAFASTLGIRQEKEQVVFKSCLRTIRVKAFFIGRSCCLLRRWRRWLGCAVSLGGPELTRLLFHKLATVSQISRERERERAIERQRGSGNERQRKWVNKVDMGTWFSWPGC